MIYYIHYNSSNPAKFNQRLLDTIKEFQGWAILSQTFFLVRVGEDRNEEGRDANLYVIKDRLRQVCDPEDEFFIGQMGNEATWQGYGGRLRDWLNKNFNHSNTQQQDSFKKTEVKDADDLIAALQRNEEIQKIIDENLAKSKVMEEKINNKILELLRSNDEMLKKIRENQKMQ